MTDREGALKVLAECVSELHCAACVLHEDNRTDMGHRLHIQIKALESLEASIISTPPPNVAAVVEEMEQQVSEGWQRIDPDDMNAVLRGWLKLLRGESR